MVLKDKCIPASWFLPVSMLFHGIRAIRVHPGKKPFFAPCQQYILDREAPDTRFDQCLQWFRVLKKVVIMTCTKSAFYAKLVQ
jgi:hypothetical protein